MKNVFLEIFQKILERLNFVDCKYLSKFVLSSKDADADSFVDAKHLLT